MCSPVPDLLPHSRSLLEEKLGLGHQWECVESFRTGKSLAGRYACADAEAVRAAFAKHIPDEKASEHSLDSFLNEIAALLVFGSIPDLAQITPQLLGFDLDSRTLVTEDLGSPIGPSTSDLLMGDDCDAARQGLFEGVKLLARFHGSALSATSAFAERRGELGPAQLRTPPFENPWPHACLSSYPTNDVAASISKYSRVCVDVGIQPASGFDDEIAQVIEAGEANPRQWLAVCKGDQNMAGDFIRTPRGPVLFDFDGAGLRHVLLEGMPCRMTWGCMLRIPEELIAEMDEGYRVELATRFPTAENRTDFRSAQANAGARWHIFHVISRLSEALRVERPRGPSTLRQQTTSWLRSYVRLAEETSSYRALRVTAERLVGRLPSLWSEENMTLPMYPAFCQ